MIFNENSMMLEMSPLGSIILIPGKLFFHHHLVKWLESVILKFLCHPVTVPKTGLFNCDGQWK
jgi:hypothetical protein